MFNHNITDGIIFDQVYIKLTCRTDSNPRATYTIEENPTIIYQGNDSSIITHYGGEIERSITYKCIARNFLGQNSSTLQLFTQQSSKNDSLVDVKIITSEARQVEEGSK